MSHLLQLLLLLALVIAVAKVAGALAVRYHQPAVLGELLAGLVLGPTLLNLPAWPMFAPGEHGGGVISSLHDLAELGVIFLMGIAGMETDLVAMRRVGRVAFAAAMGGVMAPVIGGILVGLLGGGLIVAGGMDLYHALFIATILAATSVSISAQTLLELGRLRSREGTAILGAAVIDDVIGIVLVSVVLALHVAGGSNGHSSNLRSVLTEALGIGTGGSIVLLVVVMVAFFVGAWFLGKRYLERLLNWSEHLRTSQPLLAMVLAVMLVYAWGAEWIGGVAAITGSYLAGLLIAQTHHKHLVEERLSALTYSLFVPAFFIDIGLNADARPLFAPFADLLQGIAPTWGPFLFTALICIVAIVTKVGGCMAGARSQGFTAPEALRVGVGMISRGEVGLIIAGLGLSAGLIGNEVFSVMVIMVLVTTLVTPPLLKLVFKPHSGETSHLDVPEEIAEIEDEVGVESVVGSPVAAHEYPHRHHADSTDPDEG